MEIAMTERWVEFTRGEDRVRARINMGLVWCVVRQKFNGDGPLKGKEFTFLYVLGGAFELAIEKPEHFLPPAPKPTGRKKGPQHLKVVP